MDSTIFERILALIWADFGYVLAMFPYVKPPKNLPRPSPNLPPSIWGLGEIRRDPGAGVGGSLCATRLYGNALGNTTWGAPPGSGGPYNSAQGASSHSGSSLRSLRSLLALIWVDVGYVLARFPYVKPHQNSPWTSLHPGPGRDPQGPWRRCG